ncbi:hypothetical protein Tco_0006130 [Tanacetum coccineum]
MDKDKIKQDLEEIETINIELDHRVTKLIVENEHLKQTYKQLYDSIKPTRIRSKEQCDDLINQVNIKSVKIFDLKASLQEKVLAITALKDELRKLKGKALVDNNVSNHPSDPELHQVNVEPITPKLLNKRTAHYAYIKHSQEKAAVLRDLIDHIKANYPLDPLLESAYNGSQPSGNTKKDKIHQTPSRILKNKVEAHNRKVKSSLKYKDHVVEPKGTAHVQHSKLNANSDLKCVKCNGCKLSNNHDLCVLDFINNVNARGKSRSRPTGRTFTIVGNACPLTRITTTTKVPLRKSSALDNKTPKPVVTLVYSRKPKKSKTSVPVNNYKVVQIVLWYLDSGCSKHMTGDRSQLTNFVNKFLGTVKFSNDHVAKIMGYKDYQIGNVTILRVYYVEGLGQEHEETLQKSKDTNKEKLYLLHMDLCRPLRVTSDNGKNYPTNDSENLGKLQPKANIDNTSGPVPQRKEKCMLQCALSSKEEKSSCILSFADSEKVEATLKSAWTEKDQIDNLLKERRFYTSARNPVKEILLKLNLPDHRSILTDSKMVVKDVIENGNSFKPVAQTTANANGTSTSTILGPVTTKEKAQKKNDVKARRIQLAILGENISQEDLNLKFLRSLAAEWNTHVVVWRNKPDLDTMSFDDLYNNFKIVEQEVKRTVTSSSNSSSQNMAFVSSPSSTNEVNTANVQVSTASTPVTTASTHDNTGNLIDATVYAFLANQPNGSHLVHEDLEQIHEDDLEKMDLKWQLALLSMRERRYYQRTGKKITIKGSDTAGYDK